MNDLHRWSNGEPSELESQLLAAARADRVPDALRERMASALTSTVAGTAAASSVAGTGGLWFSKAGLWGVLSLIAIAVPVFHALRTREPDRPGPRHELLVAAPSPQRPPPPVAVPAPRLAEPPAASVVSVREPSDLRAEVALLDRTRRALRSGAADKALALLGQHERSFGAGALAPEAEALRIEALLELGDRDRAEERHRSFKKHYSAHPLGERLGWLLEPPPAQPAPVSHALAREP